MTISKQNGKSLESERERSKLKGMWESAHIWRSRAGTAICRPALAIGMIGLMLSSITITAIQPAAAMAGLDSSDRAAVLSTDKRINHLLNRIAFGPRPGDIEAVRRMGIDKYIDLQLHPERINDSAIEARLSTLESLHMPIGEAY